MTPGAPPTQRLPNATPSMARLEGNSVMPSQTSIQPDG